VMVAVAAKAMAEGSGVVGQRRRLQRQSSWSAAGKAGAIPTQTMTAEAAAEAALEVAVVARRITTPPSPTGGGL